MTESTRNLLEQHFDTAFDAPDGIARLRELILTLAMQGKLVEQDPNDPPALELLKKIDAEKQRLVKAGKIKKPKPLPPIKLEEAPYELPQGWEWVRLGDLIYLEMGQSPPSEFYNQGNDGLPFFQGKADFGTLHPTPRYWCTNPQKYAYPNDVLLSVRAPVGPTNIADVECCIGRGLAALRPLAGVDTKFINFLMIRFRPVLEEKATGTTFVAVSKIDVENLLVPSIPLPEQHRIVARIDQLMEHCDALETLRKQREKNRLAVHAAAIKQLLNVPDGSAWDFIQQHFGELYTVKENVAELRKAILQLAVMGRLAPQDPSDMPASELLKEIEAEKQRLVKAGKIKKPKLLPPIKPEEVPYELPQGWEWVRLGDISLASDSGWSPQCLPEQRSNGQWGVLKVSAVSWGKYNPDENKTLPSDKEPRPDCEVKAGDFLLSRANTDELVARSVIVEETPEKLMMSDKIVRFTLSDHINKHFVNFANGTDFSRTYYIANASGTSSSMKNVSRQVMAELPIPLPPLPEQHRIVARIDQLMTLRDTLVRQIDAAAGKQTKLLNAVMAQV